MDVLLEGSPISTGTLELCQSDHRVLGHLPDQGPSIRLLSFAGQPVLGRVLVVPNFFLLIMMEATVFLGTFNANTSPDLFLNTILSRSSADNSLDYWLGVCSNMHCQLWDII